VRQLLGVGGRGAPACGRDGLEVQQACCTMLYADTVLARMKCVAAVFTYLTDNSTAAARVLT
jgi:hypothetical protein